jgi:hypothetical protein
MTLKTRLLEVGMNDAGRSGVRSQQEVELVPGQDREIWQSFEAAGAVPFYPAPGESLFRFFVLPPPEDGLTPEMVQEFADQFFAQNKIEHCRIDTSRHPFMHATPTEDSVMLLSGHAALILDDGPSVELRPFDVIRQSKTNHSWVNLGPGPAVFISLMHGVAQR